MHTPKLIYSIAVISIGSGFQHGYNIAVLNNPQDVVKQWMMEVEEITTEAQLAMYWGASVSLNPFGGMVGSAFTKLASDHLGRRGGLLLNCLVILLAGLLLGLSKETKSIYTLFVGRFIVGFNSGLNAGIAPLFISEISPTKTRGAMGSLYQLNITISILIAQIFGFKSVLGTPDLWPMLVALVLIVGFLQLVGLLFCPESPKFYVEKRNDETNAQLVCQQLFGPEHAEQQFTELKNDIADSRKMPKVGAKQMFTEKKLRRPLVIILILMTAQQLSGINAVIFYSTEIFQAANMNPDESQICTVVLGVVNVLCTVLSVWLVEASGRKPLLVISFAGMTLSQVFILIVLYFIDETIVFSYTAVALIFVYVIFFAIGAGSIPWLLGPELFNTAARALACTLAVFTNWGWAFIVGLLFPILQRNMGPAVFALFIVCNAAALAFIWVFCPETKNKSIDEITAKFE